MPEVLDFEAARRRIRSHVRRTPLLAAAPLLRHPSGMDPSSSLSLKLENLQVTGSFKARGAVNKVLSLPPERVARGLVTASGGNHGLGVAYAGRLAGAPVTIFLPENVPPGKARKLESWGARIIWEGQVWDDADSAARDAAQRDGLSYIHPFEDVEVIAGQGTLALEILEDAPETEVLLVSIGGGGLIAGVSAAAKRAAPGIRVIGVEPVGAPKIYESLRAGRVIELAEIHTRANTLAPRRSAELNFEIIRENVDEVVLVDDEEMADAARWLWFEAGVASELAGAAAAAALLTGKVQLAGARSVCAVVCGVGAAAGEDCLRAKSLK